MYKKERIAVTFDGAGIKKPPELAIPKKEFDAWYIGCTKNHLLRMRIKLQVQAIKFGYDKNEYQYKRQQPS